MLTLAAGMAMPGVGAAAVGSATGLGSVASAAVANSLTAGMKYLAGRMTVGTVDKTLNSKGNIGKGLMSSIKNLRKKDCFKGLVRAMAVAGLTTSILGGTASAKVDNGTATELSNRVTKAATQAMVNMAADVAIDSVNPGKAAVNAARSTIADSICGAMAGKLGKAYHAGQLPNVIHEGLHGLVGVMGAKIQNRSALAGAAGAISAEVFGKLYSQNSKVFNNPEASPEDLQKAIDRGVELAEITAASVATALSLDANAAVSAATIAASENSFKKQKEKLTRLLQNIQGELDEEFLVQEEQNQAETDAQVAVAKELLAEIKANPAAFFKGCAEVSGEIVVPGGVQHFSALLANKQTLSEFLTNQKRSIGEEVAMGMMVGGKLAKGSKKFKAVVKYVDGKYQAKLAQIKNFTQKQKLQQTRKRYDIDGKKFQIHHIISDKNQHVKDHPLWEKAGMIPDDYVMFLPTKKGAKVKTTKRSVHDGRHLDSISENHKEAMNKIIRKGNQANWKQFQYKEAFKKLISSERKLLKEGKTKLNKNHIGTE